MKRGREDSIVTLSKSEAAEHSLTHALTRRPPVHACAAHSGLAALSRRRMIEWQRTCDQYSSSAADTSASSTISAAITAEEWPARGGCAEEWERRSAVLLAQPARRCRPSLDELAAPPHQPPLPRREDRRRRVRVPPHLGASRVTRSDTPAQSFHFTYHAYERAHNSQGALTLRRCGALADCNHQSSHASLRFPVASPICPFTTTLCLLCVRRTNISPPTIFVT